MTGQNIIDEVRSTLMDETEPYRFSDVLMLGFLNDGLQTLFSRRPDSVIMEDDVRIRIDRPAPLGQLDDPLVMEPHWRPVLVHYVLYRAYDIDSDQHEAGAAGKALGFKTRFDEGVKVT